MKKLFTPLTIACIVFLFAGCSKSSDNTSTPSANSKLIVGTYTATKVETSTTNNGSDWKDYTPVSTVRETLIIKADNTFSTVNSNAVLTGPTTNGTWALSADGNTLTYVGIQSYIIVTLTSTSMVMTLTGPNKLFTVDQTQYPYYRFTYTRTN